MLLKWSQRIPPLWQEQAICTTVPLTTISSPGGNPYYSLSCTGGRNRSVDLPLGGKCLISADAGKCHLGSGPVGLADRRPATTFAREHQERSGLLWYYYCIIYS